MPGTTTYTQNFSSAGGGILDIFANALPINLGVPTAISKSTYSKYIVTISSSYDPSGIKATANARKPVIVTAFLQEKISTHVMSHWHTVGFFPPQFLDDASQVVIGRSLASTVASRRIWRGTEPIKMTLKLRFEAFDSILKDVIEPVAQLQAMACPREGNIGGFFLIPPGPNPFKINIKNKTFLGGGDQITIKIGQFLTFNSVIVEDVRADWEAKMGAEGPTGCGVDLTFSTYEMMTQEKVQAMYGPGVQVTGAEANVTQQKPPTADTAMTGQAQNFAGGQRAQFATQAATGRV